jgi:hypothetical protein
MILFFVSLDPHGLEGPIPAPLDSLGDPLGLDSLSAWVSSLCVS